jgi:hypothetical protein
MTEVLQHKTAAHNAAVAAGLNAARPPSTPSDGENKMNILNTLSKFRT